MTTDTRLALLVHKQEEEIKILKKNIKQLVKFINDSRCKIDKRGEIKLNGHLGD